MKKRTICIIAVASALILILTGIFIGFSYFSRIADDENKVIFQCDPENIEKINVAVGNYSYSLIKGETGWHLKGQESKKLIDKSVNEALTVLSQIKGKQIKKPEKLSFDTVITIGKVLGEAKFNLAKKDNAYYLKDKKGDVYSISQVVYSISERDENFYRDKMVFPSGNKENKFVSYSYRFNSDGKMSEINVRLKNASEVKRYSLSSQYIMDKPFVRSVDAPMFENLLTRLSRLEAKSFVLDAKSEADLSLFGLDKESRSVLTLSLENKKFVLYIGKSVDDEGIVYGMLSSDNEVFTISEEKLEFLSHEPFDLIEKSLFDFNEEHIRKISVKAGKTVFDISKENDSYFIGKTPLSKSSFDDILNKLKSVKVSFAGTEKVKKSSELLEVTIYLADGYICKFSGFSSENGKIIVAENDKLFFEINKEDFENFKENLIGFENIAI